MDAKHYGARTLGALALAGALVSSSVASADEVINFDEAKAVLRDVLGVTATDGGAAVGTRCKLRYKFYSPNNVTLFVSAVDSDHEIAYSLAFDDDFQSLADGFSVTRNVGLDCETQGCISYSTLTLRVTTQELFIEDLSDNDSVTYRSVVSLTCPL